MNRQKYANPVLVVTGSCFWTGVGLVLSWNLFVWPKPTLELRWWKRGNRPVILTRCGATHWAL